MDPITTAFDFKTPFTCTNSIKNDGTDGITPLGQSAPVGAQFPPTGWIARDFVWSLGLACPQVPNGGGLQNCTTSPGQTGKKK